MSKKYLISLSDDQSQALAELMAHELSTSRSTYIARLIGREYQAMQKEASRRPPGRPRKGAAPSGNTDYEDTDEYEDAPDYTHDEPKTIMHFGRLIGPRELSDIERSSSEFKPQS